MDTVFGGDIFNIIKAKRSEMLNGKIKADRICACQFIDTK